MNTQTRTRLSLHPYVKSLLLGLGVGVVTATLLLLLCALVITRVAVPGEAIPPMAVAAMGIGSLVGGCAVGLSAKQHGLLLGAVCGTLLYLILLILGVSRGGVAPAYAALKWAVLTVCSAAGGVLGVNRRHS